MNLNIAARNIEVTDAIRDHIEGGLSKIRRHFDKVIDVDVILSVETRKHLQAAEINLRANGLRINAKESTSDMYMSIDSALSKIERQVTKFKERIHRHQPRTTRETRQFRRNVIEISVPAAGSDESPKHKIVHREKMPLQLMTVEEAAFQLGLLEETFLMFSNVDTQQVNLVYTTGDGTYGLIEPEA